MRTAPTAAVSVERWRRVSGIHKIRQRRQLAIVRSMWNARDRDRPRDGHLSKQAAARPVDRWGRHHDAGQRPRARGSPDFHGRGSRKYLAQWWAAIAEAQQLPDDELPELTGRAKDHPRRIDGPNATERQPTGSPPRKPWSPRWRMSTDCPPKTCFSPTPFVGWPGDRRLTCSAGRGRRRPSRVRRSRMAGRPHGRAARPCAPACRDARRGCRLRRLPPRRALGRADFTRTRYPRSPTRRYRLCMSTPVGGPAGHVSIDAPSTSPRFAAARSQSA